MTESERERARMLGLLIKKVWLFDETPAQMYQSLTTHLINGLGDIHIEFLSFGTHVGRDR